MIELSAEVHIKVPFQDVDAMRIVCHGNYFRYFEEARAALLDKISYGYFEMKDSGYAWPVVDVRTKFIKPLLLQQKIRVVAKLVEYENQLKIAYDIFDASTGERTTKGTTTQVAIDMATNEMCFASPQVLFDKLGM